MNRDQLSPRVRAVTDAVSLALGQRAEILGEETPAIITIRHKETGHYGVMFQQSDDPEDALVLDDRGLSTVGNSMALMWDETQGEAFFAALIVMFTIEEGAMLQPPACPECEDLNGAGE